MILRSFVFDCGPLEVNLYIVGDGRLHLVDLKDSRHNKNDTTNHAHESKK